MTEYRVNKQGMIIEEKIMNGKGLLRRMTVLGLILIACAAMAKGNMEIGLAVATGLIGFLKGDED